MKTKRSRPVEARVVDYYAKRGITVLSARLTDDDRVVVRFPPGGGPNGLMKVVFQRKTAEEFL